MTLQIGALFGGCSGEHEVSICSAQAIVKALKASPYQVLPFYIQKDGSWQAGAVAQAVLDSGQPMQAPGKSLWEFPAAAHEVDLWFPMLHGPNGEDGTIQGLLKLMQVPFVGCGLLAAAIGMDKLAMKTAFAQAGLPQVKYLGVTRSQVRSSSERLSQLCDQIEAELGYPCFVKPANLGSSVGIAKVRSRSQLTAALESAASYDRRLIVEAGVIAREVECAVLGNDQPQASVVGEIRFSSDFYDYETKYTAGQADLVIPAQLPPEVSRQIQQMAVQAFLAIDGAGISRVDFFYLEATGEILINEINTLPGFTATSMYPQLWEASGLAFPELVVRLVELAQARGL